MTTTPISTRRGAADSPGCLILFFLIFALAGGALFWFLTLRPVSRLLAVRSWPEVPCTIVEGHVAESSDSDGSTYKPVITYTYVWDGRELQSSRYDFLDFSSSGFAGKKELVDRYPAGMRTVCWVDPADPSMAVLSRSFSGRYLVGLFGLIFLIPGALGMAWAVGRTRQRSGAPTADSTSPFGVADPQGDEAAGPRELRPQMTPLGKLFGLLVTSLIWNGIVWTVGWAAAIKPASRPEGCLIAFLGVFALIGLWLIYATLRQLLILFNPRPRLTLSPPIPTLGGTTYLQWRLSGGTGGVQRLRVLLEGREQATYRQGTNTKTDRQTFYSAVVVDMTDPYGMASGSTSFTVPADTMPSFAADHNKIIWTLKATLEVANWPDSEDEFEILVRP